MGTLKTVCVLAKQICSSILIAAPNFVLVCWFLYACVGFCISVLVFVCAIVCICFHNDYDTLYACIYFCMRAFIFVCVYFILYACNLFCMRVLYFVCVHFILYACNLFCMRVFYFVCMYFILYACILFCMRVCTCGPPYNWDH